MVGIGWGLSRPMRSGAIAGVVLCVLQESLLVADILHLATIFLIKDLVFNALGGLFVDKIFKK